jgi:hypothetical protein
MRAVAFWNYVLSAEKKRTAREREACLWGKIMVSRATYERADGVRRVTEFLVRLILSCRDAA